MEFYTFTTRKNQNILQKQSSICSFKTILKEKITKQVLSTREKIYARWLEGKEGNDGRMEKGTKME
jgi:hypothetical protein